MRKKQLLMFLGATLALFAVLAWTQGSRTGLLGAGQPVNAVAADPKDEACTETPCGKFDHKDKDKDKDKDKEKDTPCAGAADCGKLKGVASDLARGAANGPCNGPCATLDSNLEPCDGPCGAVDEQKEPCNGPCKELDVPVNSLTGSTGLQVPPGLRKGH